MEQIRVALQASDPLSQAGLASYLQARPELLLVRQADRAEAKVLVVSCDRLTGEVVATLRRCAAEVGTPVVLVTGEITETELLTAVECRVVAILPRAAVTAERLAHSVLAAANGGGVMPPNLVGELLKHIERLQRDVLTPNGLNASGLTPREIDVLRLMADGLDTNEIAGELCYSERTVKNVIYGVTHRLKLRNRSHAVAYALRAGMI
ncbi:LuxR C-terminal-related transcriptional regulator [Winogradskya consettensis]|uniref:Helix-turn-helix transcriptional regulator n=2 Tax=Winogradskya TaxID=3240235 RepID=A0A919SVS1_9ACTN|nr:MULTISPECIES: response regulator transcription factor [Actinoplanes]GIE19801.1 helix-turn-helix transcriptional regulator [Actinoplanes humidus]GIM77948.1 helix-turn-helix transcriptional regulator [Actinoplanes consettensis]